MALIDAQTHKGNRLQRRLSAIWFAASLSFIATSRAFGIVYRAGPKLIVAITLISFVTGLLPAATVYVGAKLIDTITIAHNRGSTPDLQFEVAFLVTLEATLLVISSFIGKVNGHLSSLLSDQLTETTRLRVLEKAVSMDYSNFEDQDFNNSLLQAHSNSGIPLGAVQHLLGINQIVISLVTSIIFLSKYSLLAVLIVIVAAIPPFFVNIRMARLNHEFNLKKVVDRGRLGYLQEMLTKSAYMKEVKLFGFGGTLLGQYRDKVRTLAAEQRERAIQQSLIGTFLELLSTSVLYIAYGSVALSAASGAITVGYMTLYLQMFRQGQGSVSGLLDAVSTFHGNRLGLSSLFDFLDLPERTLAHADMRATYDTLIPGDGLRFVAVSYSYPGRTSPAVDDVSFHIRPGESVALVGDNGAGKSTLVKLITGLYRPTSGVVALDGLDLTLWNEAELRERITALFQDFCWYGGLQVGENIGLGDVDAEQSIERWEEAANAGLAVDVVRSLPDSYHTQLGRRFGGHELSGGQWQRIALSRAFMRQRADLIVLDEPASAVDSLTEVKLLQRFRAIIQGRMAIVISHRFSTVRLASRIIVLMHGRIIEDGSHDDLVEAGGHYATMYNLQAEGYR